MQSTAAKPLQTESSHRSRGSSLTEAPDSELVDKATNGDRRASTRWSSAIRRASTVFASQLYGRPRGGEWTRRRSHSSSVCTRLRAVPRRGAVCDLAPPARREHLPRPHGVPAGAPRRAARVWTSMRRRRIPIRRASQRSPTSRRTSAGRPLAPRRPTSGSAVVLPRFVRPPTPRSPGSRACPSARRSATSIVRAPAVGRISRSYARA